MEGQNQGEEEDDCGIEFYNGKVGIDDTGDEIEEMPMKIMNYIL